MKFLLTITLVYFLEIAHTYYIKDSNHKNFTPSNFAFGSCFGGFLAERNDMFKTVLENEPELWLWVGDATYLDNLTFNYFKKDTEFNYYFSEKMFNETKYDKYYSKLDEKIPVIGVWDDHDYGLNDGNGYYLLKEESKKLYLDFIEEPENSERRKRGRGIYTSYSFGDITTHKNIRIILLDVRFHKNSYFDENPDLLGEEQWNWLEMTLKNANETFIFIASGTQMLPFTRIVTESWYPSSRQRLFELIAKLKKSGIIILSGDIHCSEILKTFCTHEDIGYDLYEVSSTGMSHYCDFKILFENVFANNYNYVRHVNNYSFAKIDFIWEESKNESKVVIRIIDINNQIHSNLSLSYDQLTYKLLENSDNSCKSKLYSRFKGLNEYFSYYSNNPIELLIVLGFWLLMLMTIVVFFKLTKKIMKFIFSCFYKPKVKKE